MPTSLVTGATGFLGHHLVRHLVNLGHDVHVLTRASSASVYLQEFSNIGVGISQYDAMDEVGSIVRDVSPDLVFHLATHYVKDHGPLDVDALIAANVTFGSHLLEALVGTNTVVVSTMSYFQFVGCAPRSFSLYSATKQAFLDVSDFYRVRRSLDIRSVVIYDTYGPDDTRDKLIPIMVSAARDNRSLVLGAADQSLNLLFSSDVAAGLVAASSDRVPPIVALKAPKDYSVAEIAAMVRRVTGRELDITFSDTAVANDLVSTSGEWPSPPGWFPEVDLAEGLTLCIGASPA
jgi:nucleoside-diphosphate-sugar epimerase